MEDASGFPRAGWIGNRYTQKTPWIWQNTGSRRAPERLHVVDLNGAVIGKPMHQSLIAEMARAVRIPVEVGGGIRDLETIEDYLSMGVEWVILGTVAFQNR